MLFKPPLMIGGVADLRRYPVSIRLYSPACDKGEIYRLRYRAFRHAGWIAENETGELTDRFDHLQTAFSVGAFYKGNCIGALRLAFGGKDTVPGSMPCEEVFPETIAKITSELPAKLVEFSRMSLDPAIEAKTFRAVIYASLVRAGLILAYAAETDFAVAAVHQRASRFYELVCGFACIGKSPAYGAIEEPTHLLGRDFGTLEQRRRGRNAFFCILPEEIDTARDLLVAIEVEREKESRASTRKMRA